MSAIASADAATLRLAVGSGQATYQRATAPRLLSRREARVALAQYEAERRQAAERRRRRALHWAIRPGIEVGDGTERPVADERWALACPALDLAPDEPTPAPPEPSLEVYRLDIEADADLRRAEVVRATVEHVRSRDAAVAAAYVAAEAGILAGLTALRARALAGLVEVIARAAWAGGGQDARAMWRMQVDESAAWVRRVRRMA